MANERTIPSEAPRSAATYTILSGGTAVSRSYQVLSVVVSKEVNRVPAATILLLDGEPARELFAISNAADFEPGKEIEIQAGYRGQEEKIFKGIVVRHGIKVRKQNSVLVVDCRDKAVKMTTLCKSKYTKDTTDSSLIEELIGAHGLEKDVQATTITHKQIVQYNATDWDFMLCRADVNSLLCLAEDGKIKVAKPDFSAAAALTIQYGATVHDLDAEIDARLQYKAVKGSAWDFTGQELLDSVEAEDPGVPEAGNLSADTLAGVSGGEDFRVVHSGKVEEPELQAWVNAALMKHRLAKIRGRVKTDGTAAVLPGQMIQLNGVGERFEGKLFVTGVRHEIEKGEWETVFQFGINPEWFVQTYTVQQPLAGALLPAIQGLHVGIVTQLRDDPDGEDRIMLRIPVINKEDEGTWCRICTLDAGEKRGTFFRPEIGDEVIVGFINNDPRHGVVLGMVHSSAKPAPQPPSDENHEKGYVSRTEMKLVFNDDKKSISIETPAGNKVVITEEDKKIHLEDQNGNKLTMNADGISLESSKDIKLKAAGNVKIEGVNIELSGSGQVKVAGSGGTEVSSSGITNVKGSMVNIN